MKGYRYNSEKREDRVFNNCGKEKNPNAIKFFARNMAYAEKYKFIYNEDGDIEQECILETVEIKSEGLFDMDQNFTALSSYNEFIKESVDKITLDYNKFLSESKNAKSRKNWKEQISKIPKMGAEITKRLRNTEFQELSDFERQTSLISEIKALGFEGYTTKNEIVVF